MTEQLVRTEDRGHGVCVLTLNRGDKRNALSSDLMRQLCDAIKQLEETESNRVLILRGDGKAFCAGLDLAEAADTTNAQKSAELVGEMLHTVYDSRLITIAAIHGAAIAGGAGLMSACDFVVAESGTKIGYPEVHRGLVAALVSGLLCTHVPLRTARELMLLGEIFDADRAHAIGLVNSVCEPGAAFSEACSLADKVLLGGPKAVVLSKQAVNEFTGSDFREQISKALDGHLAARDSTEAHEGFAAFFEKRPPAWQVHSTEGASHD
ncbi:MAG: enoyl-CoA hydratase/isomerase family protein [Planctomycetota bacterium]